MFHVSITDVVSRPSTDVVSRPSKDDVSRVQTMFPALALARAAIYLTVVVRPLKQTTTTRKHHKHKHPFPTVLYKVIIII